jgi:hypothetical protein
MTSRRLLRRLVLALGTGMLALFVFVVFILSRPDAYHEHQAAAAPAAAASWPDGSPRTANDWWAKPGAPNAPQQPNPASAPTPPG